MVGEGEEERRERKRKRDGGEIDLTGTQERSCFQYNRVSFQSDLVLPNSY